MMVSSTGLEVAARSPEAAGDWGGRGGGGVG